MSMEMTIRRDNGKGLIKLFLMLLLMTRHYEVFYSISGESKKQRIAVEKIFKRIKVPRGQFREAPSLFSVVIMLILLVNNMP